MLRSRACHDANVSGECSKAMSRSSIDMLRIARRIGLAGKHGLLVRFIGAVPFAFHPTTHPHTLTPDIWIVGPFRVPV